ncbi:MAG: aromatic-ring-hydroxylating dioxygenase subunit beta [Pseudomonadota bacterium]
MTYAMTLPYDLPGDLEKVSMETTYGIEQFLYEEAAAIDERRFDDWLSMLAEDLHYEAPTRYNRLPRERHREWSADGEAKHFEDDKALMKLRVKRLHTDKSWSEDPPSRTRHMVSNVRVRRSESLDLFIVDSAIAVYRARADDDVETFFGARHDHIRQSGSEHGYEVARRVILFDQTLLLTANLGIFF